MYFLYTVVKKQSLENSGTTIAEWDLALHNYLCVFPFGCHLFCLILHCLPDWGESTVKTSAVWHNLCAGSADFPVSHKAVHQHFKIFYWLYHSTKSFFSCSKGTSNCSKSGSQLLPSVHKHNPNYTISELHWAAECSLCKQQFRTRQL